MFINYDLLHIIVIEKSEECQIQTVKNMRKNEIIIEMKTETECR